MKGSVVGFPLHLWVSFSFVVECSKGFNLGNFFKNFKPSIFVRSISTSIHFENMKA
jgi:hypothetical protein